MTLIKTVVFDFDGVLLQSNAIKRDTYFKIFPSTPHFDKTICECLTEFPDVNRVQLIEHVLERTPKLTIDEFGLAHQELVQRYAEVCEEETAICDEVPGARQALDELHESFSLYINSATLESSLVKVVKRRNWEHLFKGVFGTPRSKVEILQSIMDREQITADRLLFIGDGNRDQQAAKQIGCRFVGVRNEFNDFQDHCPVMIDDLNPLLELVESIV